LLANWEGHSDIPGRATVVIDSDWEVKAVERVDPLDSHSSAPVERVTDTLHSLDCPVSRPTVQYDL
jgi:hypothetical protein